MDDNYNWSENDYLEKRLNNQILWYTGKSRSAKKWYLWLSFGTIVFSSIIPPLSTYGESFFIRIFLSITGILSVIASSVLCLSRAQEKWITYRITAENLKREEVLYKAGVFPYCRNSENRLETLIQNVENIMSTENTSWLRVVTRKTESEKCSNG